MASCQGAAGSQAVELDKERTWSRMRLLLDKPCPNEAVTDCLPK